MDLDVLVDPLRFDLLGELLIATLIGGLIGLERELSGKPAGLRTNILICVGAALLTDLSLRIGGEGADAARLAAQIVSGIGFLGAGTIIQSRGAITGLTSAATLWVVAALGIAVGAGRLVEAVGTSFLVLMILVPLSRAERHIDGGRRSRRLHLLLRRGCDVPALLQQVQGYGLTVRTRSDELAQDGLHLTLVMTGPPRAWDACRDGLIATPDVHGMRFG